MAYVYQTICKKTGKPHPLWRYQFRDYLGRKRTRTGTTSKKETHKLALQKQGEQYAIKNGTVAAPKASDEVRDIDDLIEEYMRWGTTQGGRRGHPWSRTHERKRHRQLAFWKKELKLRTQMDLIEIMPRVERVIHRLHRVEGKSGKTTWNQVESLTAFCRWCVDRDYLEADPLRRLKKINTDPVRQRRPLMPDEITKLLEHCLPERRLLYETALCTGLRANELRSLTPIHIDKNRCGLRLEAEWTKNRLHGFQPVPRWLMDKLEQHAADLEPADAIFSVQKTHPARMIQDDLERAGVPIDLPGEGRVDFHSLRMTYCTLLDMGGASAKENQELARHSTPALTMSRYVRARPDRKRDVVEAVGAVVMPVPPQYKHNDQPPHLRVLRNTA